ncbi:hhoA [Symbiodinium pilosum]|uniref:HhoA protein n=1 Tax=Symbiodinium pilosum TaxID=2952 RepID=A0A812S7X1_SYMPI|nr:hhoA [Symbiodinium pilosum]
MNDDKAQLPLPSMALGASDAVKTGDWTIVLGNPLGLQNTCTLGIVSSLDRSTGETGFDWMRHPLIQTDAAVNQGNSGGPMLNEIGEVIGMISMRALFGEGIGFAIPVDSIRTALPSLLSGKKVPRSYIGVKMAMREESGREHAVVDVVLDGSPAAEAGLKVDDQIVEVNSRKVRHFDEVQLAVRSLPVGTRMKLKVRRGEKSTSVVVTTADIRRLREASPASPAGRPRVVILP